MGVRYLYGARECRSRWHAANDPECVCVETCDGCEEPLESCACVVDEYDGDDNNETTAGRRTA